MGKPGVVGLVIALVALAAGPALASHGGWSGPAQEAEPNTRWDEREYMPQSANRHPSERVYFNGLVVKGVPVPGGPRYELQAADGSVAGPEGFYLVAILGFWRDCNRDGYIGARHLPSSFGNLAVYPREGSNLDETICPRGSPYYPMNGDTGAPNALVDEFRWIGPRAGCDAYESNCPGDAVNSRTVCAPSTASPIVCSPRIVLSRLTTTVDDGNDVTDNASKVWADWGFPGARHLPSVGFNGPLVVDGKPPGTYRDSSGTLGYVDDLLGREISRALPGPWSSVPTVGACDEARRPLEGPRNGLPAGTCGAWPLYQVKRLANDGDAASNRNTDPSPVVQVFETSRDDNDDNNPCNDFVDQPLVIVDPVTGIRVNAGHVGLADVQPALSPNPLVDGSVAGTYGNVMSGARYSTLGQENGGACGSDDTGLGQFETNAVDSEYTHRRPSDFLHFRADERYRFLAGAGVDWVPTTDADGVTGTIVTGPSWQGETTWMPRPPYHGWGVMTPAFATFYADASVEAFVRNGAGATPASALPSGQDAFRYGVPEACASATTGPSNVNPANDWECSVQVWMAKRALDAGLDVRQAARPIVGDSYDLRDVDCLDNTVSASLLPGVQAGVASCAEWHA